MIQNITCGLIMMLLLTSCSTNETEKEKANAVDNNYPGLKTFSVTLDGKERVTHAIRPDVPVIGAMGKDSYCFEGEIFFDDKVIEYKTYGDYPLCAVKYEDDYYLITGFYFVKTRFKVFLLNVDNVLVQQNIQDLSRPIYHAKLNDKYLTRSFKIICLSDVLSNEGAQAALQLLEDYVENDARAFYYGDYLEEWSAETAKNSLPVSEVLFKLKDELAGDANLRKRYSRVLEKIIFAAIPEDGYAWIQPFIACLIEVDSNKALNAFDVHFNKDFVDRFPEENDKQYWQDFYSHAMIRIETGEWPVY